WGHRSLKISRQFEIGVGCFFVLLVQGTIGTHQHANRIAHESLVSRTDQAVAPQQRRNCSGSVGSSTKAKKIEVVARMELAHQENVRILDIIGQAVSDS